jgi:four helix bundle protein
MWQLATELRNTIVALCAKPPFCQDFRLCDQTRGAAGSVVANIAEGFGRFWPRDFANFLRMARASVFELQEHLADAHQRGYVSHAELESLRLTCRRISIGLVRLIRYLESHPRRHR